MKTAYLPPVSRQFLYKNMIPIEAVKEYKIFIKKHYGLELSDKDAFEQAIKFFNTCKIIYKPIPKQKVNNEND